jgi:uncharacterized membrane protein YqhA
MNKISHGIESTLFHSSYLLAPLYLGLVGSLVILANQSVIGFYYLNLIVFIFLFAQMDWIADKRKFNGACK